MLRIAETRYILLLVAVCVSLLLFYGTSRQYGGDIVYGVRSQTSRIWQSREQVTLYGPAQAGSHLKKGQSSNVLDVFNTTLGFQHIRMISMPDRTDQRDGFSVAASLSGFEYVHDEGVAGSTISSKARPYTMDVKDNVLGCWRAHANLWESMVHKGITSALVFEGDTDWDVGIRAQMLELARGTRYVLNEQDKDTFSPYGDDWDLLWTGHCGSGPAPWTDRRYVIPFDPTVVPPAARIAFGTPDMSRWEHKDGNHTRIIYPAFSGTCTASYAISLRGARKALYRLSMQPNSYAVDIGLRTLCQDKDFGFKCVAPYPSIVGWYRPAGNFSQYSDIEAYDGVTEVGQANGLMFSARVNIDRLLKGETTFKSSFPDVTGEVMDIGEITGAVGHYETVPLNPKYQDLSNEELKHIPWDSKEGVVE